MGGKNVGTLPCNGESAQNARHEKEMPTAYAEVGIAHKGNESGSSHHKEKPCIARNETDKAYHHFGIDENPAARLIALHAFRCRYIFPMCHDCHPQKIARTAEALR